MRFFKYTAAIIILVILILFCLWLYLVGPNDEIRISSANKDILEITQGIEKYKKKYGVYPDTKKGLKVLIDKGVVSVLNTDPWGEPYHYEYPGKHNLNGYDLWSTGADFKNGGSGINADIGNW